MMNTRIALLFLFINASLALKCQVCENDGVCKNDSDNGMETDCAADEGCGYFREVKNDGTGITMRKCTKNPGAVECEEIDQDGVQLEACYCKSDHCNKDQECTCGLKCQTCASEDGSCNDVNDNGITSYCLKGESCEYIYDEYNGVTTYTRRCGEIPPSGETCIPIGEEGHSGYTCFCNEPNCNVNSQCNCEDSPGLKCMVCTDSGDGKCKNGEDMGESKECPSGQVCVFVVDEYEGETTYSRRCDSDPGTPCIEDSQEGLHSSMCFCNTENCNTGTECQCENPSSSTSNPQTTSTTAGTSRLTLSMSIMTFSFLIRNL